MSYQPHSLLDAAKIVADVAGIEWAVAHRYYRNLQGVGRPEGDTYWLPKSLGRNIWQANAQYVSALLVGLAMSDGPDGALDAMNMVASMTPGGRNRHASETSEPLVLHALTQLLIHEEQARDIDRVEFDPVACSVDLIFKQGATTSFSVPDRPEVQRGLIYRRGVIPGEVFAGLSKSIRWRRYCDSPLDISMTPDADA